MQGQASPSHVATSQHPFWPDRTEVRPGRPATRQYSPADERTNPFDLRPLCGHCKRPERQGIDGTGTWIILDHPDPAAADRDCPGSNEPVSRSAWDDAERVHRPTSVHTEESTHPANRPAFAAGQRQPHSKLEAAFRHSGWAHVRHRVHVAMRRADIKLHRLEAFETCGSAAWVLKSLDTSNQFKVASSNCHDRFCIPCALDRAAIIRTNLRNHLQARRKASASAKHYVHRSMTLTVKTTSGEPLKTSLDNLATWFTKLRKTRLWKQCVRGGVAICELKYFRDTRRWHPHLHVIWEGQYIPHDELKRAWHAITQSSYICHLKPIRSDEAAIRYLSGYVTKTMDGSFSHDVDLIREAIEALTGRKLIATFGTWHKVALLKRVPVGQWTAVLPLDVLVRRAKAGDDECRRIFSLLKEHRHKGNGSASRQQRGPPCKNANKRQTLLPF